MLLQLKTNILKEKLHNWGFSFLGLVLLTSLHSCTEEKHNHFPQLRYEIAGEAQGTTYNIVYFTKEATIQKNQVDSVLDEIDLAASVWVENSLISKFNNSSDSIFKVPFQTNSFFLDNFQMCKEVYENTNGAYNPTVGELVNAWGFGFKNRENMDSLIVDSLLQSVGFSDNQMKLFRDNEVNYISKTNPNTQLDYNGIAQGYSVDVLADYFKANGVSNFMIEVGGELLANGRKSDGSYWKIGIDEPVTENMTRKLAATIKLDNMSVATSGNYRKFYEKNGIKYSHTIDPNTGKPVQHQLLSTTVITDNCALADAYATAFMVMGVSETKLFLEQHSELNLSVYLIFSDSTSKWNTWQTKDFDEIIVQ